MKYFKIDILGDPDESLACIDRAPAEIGILDYCMSKGESIGANYPDEAIIQLDEYPGIKLQSLVGNILGYMIVNTTMKNCIQQANPGDIEYLQFTLLNHKGKEYSKDYWIVNPIGSYDVLDLEHSKVRRGRRTGEIVGITEAVFNQEKLDNAPDLFRIPQKLPEYYVSESIVKCWKENSCSNILLQEIKVMG